MVGLEALLPRTKSVLLQLSESVLLQNFTFVGGSAIAVHLYIDDIQDENIRHLNPRYDVSLQHISNYFSQEIKEWNLNL